MDMTFWLHPVETTLAQMDYERAAHSARDPDG
jgi:hypothetical protein